MMEKEGNQMRAVDEKREKKGKRMVVVCLYKRVVGNVSCEAVLYI